MCKFRLNSFLVWCSQSYSEESSLEYLITFLTEMISCDLLRRPTGTSVPCASWPFVPVAVSILKRTKFAFREEKTIAVFTRVPYKMHPFFLPSELEKKNLFKMTLNKTHPDKKLHLACGLFQPVSFWDIQTKYFFASPWQDSFVQKKLSCDPEAGWNLRSFKVGIVFFGDRQMVRMRSVRNTERCTLFCLTCTRENISSETWFLEILFQFRMVWCDVKEWAYFCAFVNQSNAEHWSPENNINWKSSHMYSQLQYPYQFQRMHTCISCCEAQCLLKCNWFCTLKNHGFNLDCVWAKQPPDLPSHSVFSVTPHQESFSSVTLLLCWISWKWFGLLLSFLTFPWGRVSPTYCCVCVYAFGVKGVPQQFWMIPPKRPWTVPNHLDGICGQKSSLLVLVVFPFLQLPVICFSVFVTLDFMLDHDASQFFG